MSGYVVHHAPSEYVEGVGVVNNDVRFISIADTYEEAQDVVSKDQSRRLEEMKMTPQEEEEFDYADWIMVDKSEYSIMPYEVKPRKNA